MVISEDLYILLLLNFSSFELEPNHAFVFLEDRVEGSESVNYDFGLNLSKFVLSDQHEN